MQTIPEILSLLLAVHQANQIGAEIAPLVYQLESLTPEWFQQASQDHGLYDTGLAGDPSEWDLLALAELHAMLAIAST